MLFGFVAADAMHSGEEGKFYSFPSIQDLRSETQGLKVPGSWHPRLRTTMNNTKGQEGPLKKVGAVSLHCESPRF